MNWKLIEKEVAIRLWTCGFREDILQVISISYVDFHQINVLNYLGDSELKESYAFEFGRYFYDDKPIIGQLAGINVWDRMLDKEEFQNFSACLNIVEGKGNIINKDFTFNITGTLVTEQQVPGVEMSCRKSSSHLFIPVRQATLGGAQDICNKIEIDSIAPTISNFEDFKEFYNALYTSPAYKRQCWHGSRMLTYLPYMKQVGEKDFLHVIDNSVFTLDTVWASWYTKAVVDYPEVIVGYMGPAESMNSSLSPFNTFWDMDYDWSSCFACNLRHSHAHSVVLKLTGQCSKSVFETYYHLQHDDEG